LPASGITIINAVPLSVSFSGFNTVRVACPSSFPDAYFGTIPYAIVTRMSGIYRHRRLWRLGWLAAVIATGLAAMITAGLTAWVTARLAAARETAVVITGATGVTAGLTAVIAAGLTTGVTARLAAMIAARETAVVISGAAWVTAGPAAMIATGLPRLPPLGRWLAWKSFLFLYDLLKTVANIRQLHDRPVV